jgi:outer membrane protein assembly factor BamB
MNYCNRIWKKTSGIWCLTLVFGFFFLACTAVSAGEILSCPEFTKISDGGFGDPQNNYAWSVSEFKGDLYVGTGRNVPYFVSLAMKKQGIFPENMTISALTHPGGAPPPQFVLPNQSPPSREDVIVWSNDMRPEIWRYHEGSWSQVHQASTFVNPLNGYTYPEGIGYRIMTTFNDTNGTDALYAGVGFGFGRVLIIKSTDGVTWVPVNTSSIPSRDTRAMTSHNGKLYVGTADGIYASGSPSLYADTWVKVADFQVASLRSFNGYLYAGTGNPNGPSVTNGFEVWRSTAASPSGPGDWTRVVSGGAGDAWNVLAASMQEYKGDLFVGSMNLPFGTGSEGLKGFDLIRLDSGDSWDLIVGNYHPKIPTDPRDPPLSGWPSGFANPFNLYAWSIGVYDGDLYLGTFDIFSFARIISDIPGGNDMLLAAVASLESPDAGSVPLETGTLISGLGGIGQMGPVYGNGTYIIPLIEHMGRELGGADLWTSRDGVHWVPVELNGFGDPDNYGFRTMLTTPDGFIIGTANPFTGCQVWRRSSPDNPPASITSLHNVSYQQDYIRWAWTDPGSADFDHVMVYLDGVFKENVPKGLQTYTASSLSPDTRYVISTRTVSTSGLVNQTWVNSTARTAPASDVKAWKFRSDLHNTGIYDDGGKRPEGGLFWNYTTGDGVSSSPVMTNGIIYVGSRDHNLYALDKATGTLLWNFTDMDNNWVSSTPAVANGIVYIGGYRNKAYALDAMTGVLLWNYTVPSRYTTRISVSSSPAVANNIVYIGNFDGNLYALNAATGALLWNYTTSTYYGDPGVFSSPAVANGIVYVGSVDSNLYALNAETGDLIWKYLTGNRILSSPALANGVVYFGSSDNNLYALDAATGAFLWNYTTGAGVSSSPAVEEGIVYFGSNDNNTYALNAETGDLVWKYLTGNQILSSPALANGVVYFGSSDNNLYALDAATGAFLWNYTTGAGVSSSPAVEEGIVYFGSNDKNLYAIGSTPEKPPASITGLNNVSYQPDYITWTWTDPASVNFDHVMVYLDGVFKENVVKGSETYNATLLAPDSQHVLSTRTVGTNGLVNETWVNNTAGTAPPVPTFLADFTVSPVSGTAPLTVQCTDESIGNPTRYYYNFGDGVSMSGPNPAHAYRFPGVYTITLSIMKYNTTTHSTMGSSMVKRNVISVTAEPIIPLVAKFTASPVNGTAPLMVFFRDESTGNPTRYYYNFGDGVSMSGPNPVHTYRYPGIYSVTLSVLKYDRYTGSTIRDVSVQKDLIVVNRT